MSPPGRREGDLTPEEVAAILAAVEARLADETMAAGNPSAALDAWTAAGRPGSGPKRRHPVPPSGDPVP